MKIKTKAITIEDVVRLSGVSRGTVSRVINDHPHVSEEKRKKVKEAIEQLDYMPNVSAQRLRNIKTKTIAVIVSSISNPFFGLLLEELEKDVIKLGYQLLLCNTRNSKKKEIDFLRLLITNQVDGIILASMANYWENIKEFVNYGPIVCCNQFDPKVEVPSIGLDHEEAAYIGTKHFIDNGHEKIAFCGGISQFNISVGRKQGYEKALKESGLKINKDWIFDNVYGTAGGIEVFNNVANMRVRPTAVFSGGDEIAVGFIKAALDSGWKVPQDISVMGFDNQPIGTFVSPELTTIQQPIEQMGKITIQKMIESINNIQSMRSEEIILKANLIERNSVKTI
ncbi:LacI family DNA-binding transcriptional regulator [Aquibacillus salsiterrae]|uniref:LacI family transcriptional regulator n=1 Tax=Aquibacillus salsiterrae TaxID=2950439 RepID=A0A9X4AEA9_9BACI|nr:LacI family DNA-binding transcriptional regulator [Aquibacillus salsiterrae]MDC3416632.1 LacI family transcriptional regulator [Aquibacillus salsiterrae]